MASEKTQSSSQSDEERVYEYHRMHMPLPATEAIFCLCSLDVRVASYAASLFQSLHAHWLIFSGGSGKLTASRFDAPEAEIFAAKAVEMGVPANQIILESRSTNTGENVRFTWDLLQEKGLSFESILLVQKPYMERRTYATFKKQWPDEKTKIAVSSPSLTWEEYANEDNPRDLVVSVMVGDLIRLKEYATRGFQVPMEIPEDVWAAGLRLIQNGYDSHLP